MSDKLSSTLEALAIAMDVVKKIRYDFYLVAKFDAEGYKESVDQDGQICCPYCGSSEIGCYNTSESIDVSDEGHLKLLSECSCCNSHWYDHYKFHHAAEYDK